MHKIKAYKGRGVILPVDDAKIGVAYRCRWTNKVFGTKSAYVKHLKSVRQDRIHRNIRKKILDNKFNELINLPTFDAVIQWLENNPEFLFDRMFPNGPPSYRNLPADIRDKFWFKITFLDIGYSKLISNSHSCPRGGVTCWSSREAEDGRPRGYPGWGGRIEYQMSHDVGFGSDVVRGLGIHTGTGGGTGNNRYGYDVKFFESDWPGIGVMNALLENQNRFRYGEPRYFR